MGHLRCKKIKETITLYKSYWRRYQLNSEESQIIDGPVWVERVKAVGYQAKEVRDGLIDVNSSTDES